MAKQCTSEQTASRQQWIENGLLELMLEKKFDEITVTELCSRLSLSRRSFYRYFDDLEDVLDSLLNHTFQNMALTAQLPELAEMEKTFEFWYAHRNLLDALNRSRMIDRLFEYTTRYVSTDSIIQYLPPDDFNHWQEASLFAISGSISLAIAWYSDGFRKSPAEMARICYRLLYTPILERKN